MTKTGRTIHKRIESQRGFSLTEVLAVILVMTLVGIMMTTGIPTAQKAYMGAMDGANAESVLFTTVEQLRSKLSAASRIVQPNPKSEGSVKTSYEDVNSGVYTSIVQKDDGIYIDRWSAIDEDETPQSQKLIPTPLESGAKEQLIVRFKNDGSAGINWDSENGVYVITGLEVTRVGEDSPLAELGSSVMVKPVITS